jgi:hypothetical protein
MLLFTLRNNDPIWGKFMFCLLEEVPPMTEKMKQIKPAFACAILKSVEPELIPSLKVLFGY